MTERYVLVTADSRVQQKVFSTILVSGQNINGQALSDISHGIAERLSCYPGVVSSEAREVTRAEWKIEVEYADYVCGLSLVEKIKERVQRLCREWNGIDIPPDENIEVTMA